MSKPVVRQTGGSDFSWTEVWVHIAGRERRIMRHSCPSLVFCAGQELAVVTHSQQHQGMGLSSPWTASYRSIPDLRTDSNLENTKQREPTRFSRICRSSEWRVLDREPVDQLLPSVRMCLAKNGIPSVLQEEEYWSPMTLVEKLVKTGDKLTWHSSYITFQQWWDVTSIWLTIARTSALGVG